MWGKTSAPPYAAHAPIAFRRRGPFQRSLRHAFVVANIELPPFAISGATARVLLIIQRLLPSRPT